MRLSTILELLLIFLIIAFSAYGRVIEPRNQIVKNASNTSNGSTVISLKQATESMNKYCVCNENICNCCREFHIPLVQLAGPGCASLQYLQDDKLAMQLSIGDNILSSNIINGKNPKSVCVTLPGGFSKFCGKIYSIKREADKNFKACLGLELRSAAELEASLRVSCFRFGPDGLKLRPAEPLPPAQTESPTPPDDDYDDLFGLDDDEDDDEDDDDDDGNEEEDYEKLSSTNNVSSSIANAQPPEDEDSDAEDDEDDLLGFGALFDIFSGADDSSPNKKTKITTQTPLPFAIPILASSPVLAPVSNEYHTSESPIIIHNSLQSEELVTKLSHSPEKSPSKINIVQGASMHVNDQLEEAISSTFVDKNNTKLINGNIGMNNTISKIKIDTRIDTKTPIFTILKNPSKIGTVPEAINSQTIKDEDALESNGKKKVNKNGAQENMFDKNGLSQVENLNKPTNENEDDIENGNNADTSVDDKDEDDEENESDIDSDESIEGNDDDETQDDDNHYADDSNEDINSDIIDSDEDDKEDAIADALSARERNNIHSQVFHGISHKGLSYKSTSTT